MSCRGLLDECIHSGRAEDERTAERVLGPMKERERIFSSLVTITSRCMRWDAGVLAHKGKLHSIMLQTLERERRTSLAHEG